MVVLVVEVEVEEGYDDKIAAGEFLESDVLEGLEGLEGLRMCE